MKAKSIGVHAEDYETGKVKNIDELYTGKNIIEDVDGRRHRPALPRGRRCPREEPRPDRDPYPNEYFIMRNGTKSALTTYSQKTDGLRARREAARLRHPAAQRRADLLAGRAHERRHQARHPLGQGRAPARPSWPWPRRWSSGTTTSRSCWRGPSSRCPTGTSATCPATSRASSTPTCSRSSTTSR